MTLVAAIAEDSNTRESAGIRLIAGQAYPSWRRAAWFMGLLFLAANLYNVDRLIVAVLAEPIKRDVRISDVQVSLLIGAAYSLLSCVCGICLGWYLDRANRRTIVAIGLCVWSLATIAGGISASFGWLFAARAIVGLGEAALTPGAMSIIADLYPPGRRARALALYSIGATCGTALSTFIPGLILHHDLRITMPGYGLLAPWRTAFVLCGLAGPAIAALLLATTREPKRQGLLIGDGAHGTATLRASFGFLAGHFAIFGPALGGLGCFYLASSSILAWTPTFLTRTYAMSLEEVSTGLAGMLLIAGGGGYICGGLLFDWKALRPTRRKLGVMGAMALLAMPSAFAMLAPRRGVAMLLLASISFTAPILNVGNGAITQDLLPNNMRSFTLAMMNVVTSLVGLTLGPLLVALTTQKLFGNDRMIGASFMVVVVPALLCAFVCYVMTARGVRAHLARGGLIAGVIRSADAA